VEEGDVMEYLIFAMFIAIAVNILFKPKRKARYKRPENKKINSEVWAPIDPVIASPAQQGEPKAESSNALKIALTHKYEKQRLFNKGEEEVFKLLLRIIHTHAKGQFRVNGQTSLGELLRTKNTYAFNVINFKRVDFCIVDKDYLPVAVIEVNGSGHYQNNALERDEIKRAAVESAGIKYIALRENENKQEKLERELIYVLTQNKSTDENSVAK